MADRIVFADALRGVAALSVVVAHYGFAFWTNGSTISQIANIPAVPDGVMPHATAWMLGFHSNFSFAAFGVSLFFLISGFVIPISLDRLGALAFLRARAWRLIPTYMAGFLFTLAALAGASWFYSRPFPYSATDVLAHLVPGIRAITRTTFIDYVVWTLEIEIAFYVLCAVTAPWVRRGSLLVLIPPTLLLALSTNRYGLPAYVFPIYPAALDFMFIGVVISFHHSGKLRAGWALAAGLFVALTSLIAVDWTQGIITTCSYIWALAVFGAAYLSRARFPDITPLRWPAAISYPLYVVHGIMGYVAMRIMIDFGVIPGVAVLIAFAWAVSVSTALHILVELPTQRIGKTFQNPK
jgi:peptidoglycan/LPS O-acetylase OafA/YrhL